MSNGIVIIYCHPYQKSFTHAVLESVQENLSNHNTPYKTINLYQDKFEPIYDLEELRIFSTGGTHDPLVEKYLNLLKSADSVIFITPIWWNDLPGMLKGFINKVMKEGDGLSHTVTKYGIKGGLTNIKHAYVLTSSTSPTFYFKIFMGNGIQKIFINQTLKQIGIKKRTWINFGRISNSTKLRRQKYLSRIRAYQFKAN
ncbi:NAD(P)H-dependent oxidoreductase [Leuconostoc mesenteroides]|uniref:NAD(P)H-dependent oxidoreductase n=1 Tax=Leuconostoc mesenteroides TaxID=1245 RepID=UPI000C9A219C|nr:NAD(P)H-dependent oxidoreductase [Leuconostoc mesenteroides]PND41668.1 NAD(P)H dehydrogenase [Leuconostoc mesenteroides]UVV91739.1 NAD(P)H-dependent oxidoreductase [Leuconostoc mesenteroides]